MILWLTVDAEDTRQSHAWAQLLPARWTRWQEAAGWTWQNSGGSLWSPRHQKCCGLHRTVTHKPFCHNTNKILLSLAYEHHRIYQYDTANQKVTSEPATQFDLYGVQNRCTCTPHSSSRQSTSKNISINKWETPAVYELGPMHREALEANGGGVLYQGKHVKTRKFTPNFINNNNYNVITRTNP